MAKRSGKCPKCGEHLEFGPASGPKVVCPGCGAKLTVGKSHPPADPPDQPDPLIGMTLGEFEIGELLGRGAMGAVYKASQPSLDRMVAIKVLPRGHSEKFATRFEREARAAAAVNHPNIINIYSVGSDQGYQYIAMEFVDGETLGDILKREGQLPPQRVIEMMKQTASAMVAAHGAGIIHRDIKPDNILLTPRGDVKVADFGLAKRPEVDVSVTQAGKPLGTPLYMPPEVARGGEFQVASDLYSLGATFYHLLAGRPPFEGGSQTEIAVKQVESDPPPLTETAPHVPQALAWAIDRLLARKPAERFPKAEALLENLNYIDAGMAASQSDSAADTLMPAAKRRALDKMPVAKKAKPNKLLIGGIAAGVLVVAVVLILIFTLGPKDETPPVEKPSPPGPVTAKPTPGPKPGPVVKPKPKPKPPVTAKPKPKPPEANQEWTTLPNGWKVGKPVNLGPVLNSSAADNDPSVSADGRTMVFSSHRGGDQGKSDLWMSSRRSADAPWAQPANLGTPVNTTAGEYSPSLSADGLTLAFNSDRGGGQGNCDLWVCTRRGRAQAWGPPVNLGPPVNTPVYEGQPCLSTDGLTLIFTRGSKLVKNDLWMSSRPSTEAPWGQPTSLGATVNTKGYESNPSLSADGLTLVFDSNRPGGQGSFDLWMSARAGVTRPFGEPVNLGPSVNTGKVEGGACLSAGGRTLYFSADRPGGHGAKDIWQAPLLPPVKPGPVVVKPKPKPKPPSTTKPKPKPKPPIQKPPKSDVRWASETKPAETKVAAWDFAGAAAELAKLKFKEKDLTDRLGRRRDEVDRLVKLKARIIERVGKGQPWLKRRSVAIRGPDGVKIKTVGTRVVKADDRGVTMQVTSKGQDKTELQTWQSLASDTVQRFVELAVDRKSADDQLAVGLLALARNDAAAAEKHFDNARTLGAEIDKYLDPLVAAAFAGAKELLDNKKFSEAAAVLAALKKKYAGTSWVDSHKKDLDVTHDKAEAEKLYAQAATLFKEARYFDLKPIVLKLKKEYADSRAVKEEKRKPSFAQMEQAIAELGKLVTVSKRGKADFQTIQAAINAAPAKSVVEIQDSATYKEEIIIPKEKAGLTLRGKRGTWPVLTLEGKGTLMVVRSPRVTIQQLVMVGVPRVDAESFHLRSVIASGLHPGKKTICKIEDCVLVGGIRRGHAGLRMNLSARNSLVLLGGITAVHADLHNVFVTGKVDASEAKLQLCTLTDGIRCEKGELTLLDSILSCVEDVQGGAQIDHCNVFGKGYLLLAKPGKGCMKADPQFRNPKNFDYRLKPTSPCLKKASDGGDIGVRFTPEMLKILNKALELRKEETIKF